MNTGFLAAESQRFVSRRMTRYFPLTLLLLVVVGVVIAYFIIRANDESVDFVRDLAFSPGGFGEAIEQPENTTQILGPLGFLLPIMGFTLGASFFGADQKAGVIELLLTWQPKRAQFLAARSLGGSVLTGLITIVLSTFVVAVMYALAAAIGTTDGMTGEMWWWIAQSVLRSGVVAALFFLIGLGLTVILNNSLASIIAFIIYAFVIENLLSAFVTAVQPWLPMTNASAYVAGSNVVKTGFFVDVPEVNHGPWIAGLVVVGFALLAMIPAVIVFNRRDIA